MEPKLFMYELQILQCQNLRERERERELKTSSENIKFRPKYILLAIFFVAGFLGFTITTFASSTNGTIDSTSRYAWTENAGWLDFGGSYSSVSVTDSALSGYAFSETLGWISLNCSNTSSCATVDYKVSNDGSGTLSGYAWGENVGWVKFDPTGGGVTINSSGEFSGYAYGENIGWIIFNCSTTNSCATVDYKVSTDYRPQSARSACNNSLDDDSDGKTDYPSDPGCLSASDTDETDPTSGNGAPGGVSLPSVPSRPQIIYPDGRVVYLDTQPATVSVAVPAIVESIVKNISHAIGAIIPSFLKNGPAVAAPSAPPEVSVSKTTPLVFSNKLNLISASSTGRFVLDPLPSEILALAKKFPTLGKTFATLGITKISDLAKLKNATFVLPGLSGAKSLPLEIVFAKTGDLIDYNIHLSINDAGNPEQTINTIAGKSIGLVVKVDKPAKSVKGYLVVKNIDRQVGKLNVPANSLMAAPIMAVLGTSIPADQNVQIENKMLLNQFEYHDKNNDGIYTAEIQAPQVHGEYEIISVIEYTNVALGKKELRLTTVVDPEGYIYESNGNKETRIPEAKVSLFLKNQKTGVFELWPAKDYSQVNPQKTDKSGTYSFLVPEGAYKLTVSAPGYYDFTGKAFDVTEGRGVHDNIPLQAKSWWKSFFSIFNF